MKIINELSAKVSCIKDCIPVYNNIPVVFLSVEDVKISGKIAMCRTPKESNFITGRPSAHVAFYNTDSSIFYGIAKEGDPFGTECIMKLIRNVVSVSSGNDGIYYTVFTLLHEASHYFDYTNNPADYNNALIMEAKFEKTIEYAMEYRKRALEKKADDYALENMQKVISEINTRLFHGMLC